MAETQYRVLLYNDDRSTMESVTEALLASVPHLSEPQAIDIMMSAHTFGLAQVTLTDRTHAAAYCQNLKELGLTCAISLAGDLAVRDEAAIER
ncbi:MAG: ATP-dependent Clp protease adaptor ClpS [Cyanobacteria bacterium J06641_5]